MAELPEPLTPSAQQPRPLPPALVKAAVSPAAVAATAAGAGIGLLDHSIVLTIVLAACGWVARMAAAVVSWRRRERAARPRPANLDPWSVPEPWRQLLQQALAAQSRFDQTVAGWPPGPTRERLTTLQPRVYQEVAELGALARRGAAATGWTGATFAPGRPSAGALSVEIKEVQAERARLGGTAPDRAAELSRREDALAAQLRALNRAEQAGAELQDRLRRAVARLDETVTELVSTPAPADMDEPIGVASALDELSDGITTLRAALTETSGASAPDTGTP